MANVYSEYVASQVKTWSHERSWQARKPNSGSSILKHTAARNASCPFQLTMLHRSIQCVHEVRPVLRNNAAWGNRSVSLRPVGGARWESSSSQPAQEGEKPVSAAKRSVCCKSSL